MTEDHAAPRAGWIFFDADCRFCVAGRRRWGRVLERRGFAWLPLQTPGTAARLGVPEARLLDELRVLPAGGPALGGLDAVLALLRHVWWLRPLAWLLGLPALRPLVAAGYRRLARHRHCLGGQCRVTSPTPPPPAPGVGDALFLLAVPALAAALAAHAPRWVFMWTLGIGLGLAGKGLTWRDARAHGLPTPLGRTLGWFLLWPGLDSRAFFAPAAPPPRPPLREWCTAGTQLALGLVLFAVAAPRVAPPYPLAGGWIAMIGTVLTLHFGLFHLLSLAWRRQGVHAHPIMRRPLAASSLAGFWGERWNTAFSIPARRFLFAPFARRLGLLPATTAVFLVSGLLHEGVISLPARAGYGMPTAYFLLQAAGILAERSTLGRRIGLGRGLRGWLFMALLTAGPLGWLFPPAFIHAVVLPMLDANPLNPATP